MIKVLSENLGLRILLLSFGMSALLALIVILVLSQLFLKESKQRFMTEMQVETDVIVELIDDSFIERRQALVELAKMLQKDGQLKPKQTLQKMLDERILLHEFFNGGLLVLDSDAVGIADSPILQGRVGTQYADRPHVEWVAQNLQPYISHPFVGRRLQAPIFIMNVPVMDQDSNLLGYLIGISLLEDDYMVKDLAKRLLDIDSQVFIIDFENQQFVSSTDSRFVFKDFEQEVQSPLMMDLKVGKLSGESVDFDNQKVFFRAKQFEHVEWDIVTVKKFKKVMAPTYQLLMQSSLLVLLFFMIMLPLFYLLLRRLLQPVSLAAQQTQAALQQPIPVKPLDITTQDEVGRLIAAFNCLIERQNQQHVALIKARDEARNANEMKSNFLAAMSHDIRTPLNGILGLSELGLRAQGRPQKMQDSLQKIQWSGQGLLTLLNDILDLSKIEAGELNVHYEPFCLVELVQSLKVQFEPQIKKKGIDLTIDLSPDLFPVYNGCSDRLGQVLTNLIGNALKFTHHGSVRLGIHKTREEAQRVWLKFQLEDTGIGMTEEQMGRLFQAFSQGDDSIAKRFGGTGLGLKICQDLVGLMGGTQIEVTSQPEQGSVFSFELPMTLCSQAEIEKTIEEVKKPIDSSRVEEFKRSLHGCVLVAEDNLINQEIMVEMLDQFGLEVYIAEDGQQAVDMAAKQTFDLILMDKQMPVLDGYEASRKIREFNQNVPIVVLTASAMVDEQGKAKAAGLDDFLAKPINSETLLNALLSWLNTPVSHSSSEVPAGQNVMRTFEEQAPWLDVDAGLEMLGGNAQFYLRMLKAYQTQLTDAVQWIENSFQSLDLQDEDLWLQREKKVHTLKGVSANLAVLKVVSRLDQLETLILLKQPPDLAFWQDWNKTIEQTQQQISQVLADLSAVD